MKMVETKPKMSFEDFLESTWADDRNFRKYIVDRIPRKFWVPPLQETHIFRMGDDEDIMESILPIRDDIAADCREGIPMPFNDMACVSTVPWEQERHWILDRIIANPPFRSADPPETKFVVERGWEIKQHLFVMRYAPHNRQIFGPLAIPSMWNVWFCGTSEDARYKAMNGIDPVFHEFLSGVMGDKVDIFYELTMKETASILEQLAAISHPQNYVVRVTPGLTPREQRRSEAGEPRPARKSPHFIVVDHEVLVRMSGNHYGTHASPVPHERRGHWRRLAERCRLARAEGKSRIFVRPAYVGERTFSDPKNQYEVLLDFGKPQEEKP